MPTRDGAGLSGLPEQASPGVEEEVHLQLLETPPVSSDTKNDLPG